MAPWGDGPAEVEGDGTDTGSSTGGAGRIGGGASTAAGGGSGFIDVACDPECPEGFECIAGECVEIDTGAGTGDADDDVGELEEYDLTYPCDVYTNFEPNDHATLIGPDSANCAFLDPDLDPSIALRIEAFTY